MYEIIIAILFIMLCFNPSIAIAQWIGLMSIDKNKKIIKIVQTINAISTIILFILVVLLEQYNIIQIK